MTYISYDDMGERISYRRDSIEIGADQNCKYWYTWIINNGILEQIGSWTTNKSLANPMQFSTLRNPFSDLNIAGFPAYWPEKGNRFKVLGNRYYPAIYNSNILAYFLDQGSRYIMTSFFFNAWNSQGYGPGGSATSMLVGPVASSIRPAYPSKYNVSGSTSIAGDYIEYRFTYR